jgi:hypothetical protein
MHVEFQRIHCRSGGKLSQVVRGCSFAQTECPTFGSMRAQEQPLPNRSWITGNPEVNLPVRPGLDSFRVADARSAGRYATSAVRAFYGQVQRTR